MLKAAGIDGVDPADKLRDGSAMDRWRAMIGAQGGDPDAPLPKARHTEVILSETEGVVCGLDAMAVGLAAWRLGAGRARQGEAVQAAAGIEMHAKPGQTVSVGTPLATLHTDTPERFRAAKVSLANAWTIVADAPSVTAPLVIERIEEPSG
jgi:thymidine phosphorylase